MLAIKASDNKIILTEADIPKPKINEVLIKTYAAGINRPDIIQRQGNYSPPIGITDILGLEVAGEIIEINGDTDFKIGDKICALIAGGGYSEYCTAPISQILPIPKNLSYIEAAGIPEVFFTAWYNIFMIGKLKKNDKILIHGGSSGIGTAAIQLAKSFGAEVFITAGNDDKCKFCKDLGANHVINYKTQDFVSEILNITENQGVNIILDMVGGSYVDHNLKCLTEFGRHVSIATQLGRNADINIFRIMAKRLQLTGSTLRPRSLEEKQEIRDDIYKNIWDLFETGKIKPIINKIFALKDAGKAHDFLESGQNIGKVILKVRD